MANNEDNKPKTYLDRETRKNDRYVFVSYAHKDSEEVYHVLNSLYDKGVDYWYDADFEISDTWDERAYAQLEDKKCVGAIVFISFNTCLSDACHKEIKKILELKQTKEEFLIIPVIIGYQTMSEASGDIRDKIDDGIITEERINNMQFSISDKLRAYRDITKDDRVLFVVYDKDTSKWLEEIMKPFEKINVVEYQTFRLDNTVFTKILNAQRVSNKWYIQLGNYDFEKEKDNQPIEWLAVRQNQNDVLMISKYVIDYATKDDIYKVIKNVKESLKNKKFVEDVDIVSNKVIAMDGENIDCFIPTDFADKNRTQILRLNFVKDYENNDNMLYCNYNGELINARDLTNNMTCGVRLTININLSKVSEEEKNE